MVMTKRKIITNGDKIVPCKAVSLHREWKDVYDNP